MNVLKYTLEGLDCEHCAAALQRRLSALEGVEEAEVLYPQCTCMIKTEKDEAEIADQILALIHEEEPDVTVHEIHDEEQHHHHDEEKAVYLFTVKGVDCEHCAARLRDRIAAIEGIADVSFDYDDSLLKYTCDHDEGSQMAEAVMAVIRETEPEAEVTARGHEHLHQEEHCHHEHDHAHRHEHEEAHHAVTAKTRRFSITGIDCADCAAKLEGRLAGIEGIENVSISFMNSTLMYDCREEDRERVEAEVRKITAREEPEAVISALQKGSSLQLKIHKIDCADCAAKLARRAEKIPGVIAADADFMHEILNVSYTSAEKDALVDALKEMIREEEPEVEVSLIEKTSSSSLEDDDEEDDRVMLVRLLIGGALFVISLFVSGTLQTVIPIIAWLILGYDVLLKAVRGIGRGQVFDEHFLMAVATIAALYLKDYREAAGVMLFYQIGEYFQDRAVRSSRKSIAGLMDIRSEYAMVLRDGEFCRVDPADVMIGETIRVVAGEKIPLDGIVAEGSSSLDTASLTGESKLRDVDVNDEVISGVLNMNGTLLIRVTKLYADSTVARILELVENADSRKSTQEKFITKFSRWYTPAVVLAAIVTAAVVAVLTGNVNEGIYRACTFLVISCPCALVISIPLSFFAGIGGLSGEGILVKGANLIDDLAHIRQVIMDKTGTLTSGSFAVSEIRDAEDEAAVLKDAAYAEHISNHPLALGIRSAWKEDIDETLIRDAEEIAGRGLKVRVNDDVIMAGNAKMMQENGIACPAYEDAGTLVYVAKNGRYEGCLILRDQLKDNAAEAVSSLQNVGVSCCVVSGDSRQIVAETASLLNCRGYGECLPQDKVRIVEELKKEGKTAFVGDGVNDAPVLAAADIGMAMGALGSDAAIEAADVVLMDDDPGKIAVAISNAERILKVAGQNIYGAISIKILTLILGAFGIANMWMAIFADTGVAMLCVLNAMRLLRVKK